MRRVGAKKVLVGFAAAAALFSVAAAMADDIERVQVGASGRNETLGFSPQLYVDLGVVADYAHTSDDGDEGDWKGPQYHATGKPALAGDFLIGWGVAFDHTTLDAAARRWALSISNWTVVTQGTADVPHLVRGTKVGVLRAVTMVAKSPGTHGSLYKSALAIPLCRGLVATAHFSARQPFTDSPNPYGTYVAPDGTNAGTWNSSHVTAALQLVSVDGYLPLGRVSARAAGRAIRGVATDCAGHAAAHILVRTKGSHATTSSTGVFVLHVKRAGTYVVTASSGGAAARSAAVRVR